MAITNLAALRQLGFTLQEIVEGDPLIVRIVEKSGADIDALISEAYDERVTEVKTAELKDMDSLIHGFKSAVRLGFYKHFGAAGAEEETLGRPEVFE